MGGGHPAPGSAGSSARARSAVAGDVVIDVLRRVSLIVHEEASVAQADVLHGNRITRRWLRAAVRDLQPPQPKLVLWVQPKRDAVPQAVGFAVPGEAIGRGAEADLRAGANRLRDRRLGPRMRRYRRAIPPSSGEPCTWLISVRPRSRWCSMAKRQPLGRTQIARPDWFAMLRRPDHFRRASQRCERRGASSSVSRLRPMGWPAAAHRNGNRPPLSVPYAARLAMPTAALESAWSSGRCTWSLGRDR